jgi:hypothetical protein
MSATSCLHQRRNPPAPAGDWPVVRVTRFYGLQALDRLRTPGTVVVDPDPACPAVVFFVHAGDAWPPAAFTPPPADQLTPPGAYWLLPPTRGRIVLTDTADLQQALARLLPEQAGTQP